MGIFSPLQNAREVAKVEKEVRELSKAIEKDTKETVTEKTWNKNFVAYTFLVAVTVGIVSSFELHGLVRIGLILASIGGYFYLCFFNAWFKRKIVDILTKSQKEIEKSS